MPLPPKSDTTGPIPSGTPLRLPEGAVIQRVEERATLGKRVVDQGGVRVATRTETRAETLRDTVKEIAVEVERVPVGRFVEAVEPPRSEGDLTILPVYEERLVVEKRLFLVEEVHIRRQARSREVEVPVEIRRQVAEVERLPPLDGPTESPDAHSGDMRMMDDITTTSGGSRIVTALFDNGAEAERAVSRLRAAGIPDSQIRVTSGGSTAMTSHDDTTYRDQHKGFWDSLGDFFFPDEDRYTYAEGLTRGSTMVTVTGFDAAHHDTIVDILDDEGSVDLSARETEWRSSGWSGYQGSSYRDGDISGTGGMAGGSSGLSGAAGAGMGAAAMGTDLGLNDGTSDLNTRGTIYDDGMQDRNLQMAADMGRRSQADLGSQQAGYASSGSMGQTGGEFGSYRDDELNEDGTVKVVEERLAVGKREQDLGRVRVRSYVREVPVEAGVDLRATRVHIERRPVDRAVGVGDIAMTDQVLEARESAEVPVVAKEARVVEEIGLRSETEVQHQTIQDTVRKTEVEIEDERTGERTGLTGGTLGTDRDRI
ncbi:DUF2382 domain-containing protein [Rubellimicrobium aerolatum]|uniref:DUF2382 domain-containing protein n=1 Tax=Rubellimicrobium aerolatum TaxID=490979 RepID=A0ABW0S8Y3_9RHOB|nr:DUF2382 domain-containing protein [Rubellimicrobium aerolatum]MBP1804754.1 stress response protein YsnF [Rubellimicrobium aerolatum]